MAKLTSDLQDLRKKDIKALKSLVLEIRENQFKNRMKHKTGQLTESHLLTIDRKKIAQKFGEESAELIIDYLKGSKKRTIEEATDLIYHLFVLLSLSLIHI